MTLRLRRMKPYHPRKRAKRLDLNKQTLHDLQHKLSSDIGSLIILIKEGNPTQITQAQQKAKTDYLKLSSEMKKIAQTMGERFSRAVRDYLDSVDMIVHSHTTWIDDAKIQHCYSMTEKLEKELGAA